MEIIRTRRYDVDQIVHPVVRWFRREREDLPWRRTRDPYRILVSEVMLQQTQVATALPYYGRFLARFPTARALARARLDDVLKAWEGLGYYARARNLHRAAARLDPFPRTVDGLRRLPGVGPYTAAAVASIAFGVAAPVVDGNVRRVVSRLLATADMKKIRAWLEANIESPGDFNQGLMELGRRVCAPRNPRCRLCPMSKSCRAFARDVVDKFPPRKKSKPLPHHDVGLGVVWRRGRVLIQRRREDGLLGGLWEFPGGKRRPRESYEACVRREIRQEVGIAVAVRASIAVVDHAYSHFKVSLHAYACDYVAGRPRGDVRWARLRELDRFAMPAANRALLASMAPSAYNQKR